MQVVAANVATIDHNDQPGERVALSIFVDDAGRYGIMTNSGEDTGHRFASQDAADDGIYALWGNGWNLEYAQ